VRGLDSLAVTLSAAGVVSTEIQAVSRFALDCPQVSDQTVIRILLSTRRMDWVAEFTSGLESSMGKVAAEKYSASKLCVMHLKAKRVGLIAPLFAISPVQ
jgi:hypothetical protein